MSHNEDSNKEYRNYQQRDHENRDEQDKCDDCENADPYDPHEVNKWAHCFCLSIEVNNSVFKGAFTFKISTFKIHVDVLGSTTRAHRPVIIHKPNRLSAVVARRSFFHYVKAHSPSISLGCCTVFGLLANCVLEIQRQKGTSTPLKKYLLFLETAPNSD